MYWDKLDASDRLALAKHIYLAAVSVTDVEAAKSICADALDRAGGREGEAERLAQMTFEDYVRRKSGMAEGNPD